MTSFHLTHKLLALVTPALALVMLAPMTRHPTVHAQSRLSGDSTVDTVAISRLTRVAHHTVGISVGAVEGGDSPTISALLQGRVSGLDVLRSGGGAAEGSRVRVRGPASVFGDRGPLVIVDGIPVSSDEELWSIADAIRPSLLDDFIPDEIERVDVLRGPAAAALYGPGAGAGVISITTKRGHPGPLRWAAHAANGVSTPRADFPANYQMAGILSSTGQPTPRCSLTARMEHNCTPTTLSVWNPLEQASPFRAGRSTTAGASVSGSIGAAAPLGLRLAATTRREQGITSDDDERRYHLHGAVTHSLLLPVVGRLGLDLSMGYTRRDMAIPAVGNLSGAYNPIAAGLFGSAVDDSVHGYRTSSYRVPSHSRGGIDHFTGSFGTRWSPLSWLEGALTVGRDRVAQRELRLSRLEFPAATLESREFATTIHELTSTSLMSAIRYTLGSRIRARTIAALERSWSHDSSHSAAQIYDVTTPDRWAGNAQWWRSHKTFQDFWLREELAWGERLFVNSALRWDRRWNAFDDRKSRIPYPSVDVSWLVGPTIAGAEVRLRGAYGRVASPTVPVPFLLSPPPIGSPPLSPPKPESMSEYEAGFDAAWHGRTQLGLTLYRRDVENLFIPADLGGAPESFYTAHMHTSGIEALVRADLVGTTRYRWDVALTLGSARNRIDALGGRSQVWLYQGSSGPNIATVGNPYGGYWGASYRFTDANRNGQLDSTEVQPDGPTRYLGSSTPTFTAGLHTRLVMPLGLTVAAIIDYHGGFKMNDYNGYWRCQRQICRAMQDPSTPLEEQAAAYAEWRYQAQAHLQDASFAKLRELRMIWRVPSGWSRQVGATDAAISIVGRNLATWTRYRGLDPEISEMGSALLPRSDFAARPIPRLLEARMEVGVGAAGR